MASNGKPSSPHGDPLRDEIEPNMAQRQRDAPPDERIGEPRGDLTGSSDRAGGRRSTGGGVPAFDEDAGEQRRRQSDEGDGLVSDVD